jgi:hypothetical protein
MGSVHSILVVGKGLVMKGGGMCLRGKNDAIGDSSGVRQVVIAAIVLAVVAMGAGAQAPTREYIRFGGKIIAIENPSTITVTPVPSSSLQAGQTSTLTASTAVTWSLSSGPGSLSTTSGPSVSIVYTAPASIPVASSAIVTASANGISQNTTIVLSPPATIVVTASPTILQHEFDE